MSFSVRDERASDREAVLRVVFAAFGAGGREDHGHDVVRIWDGLGDHRRAGLVAEEDGSLVGHVGLSRGWIDARESLVDVWVLSPLSVVPERQRDGIGTALVAAAIETARGSGTPVLFLEGSPSYYGARGFERADVHGFLPASLERTPRPAFQCVRFDSYEDWHSGQLIYPSIWWENDSTGLRDPALAEVLERLGG